MSRCGRALARALGLLALACACASAPQSRLPRATHTDLGSGLQTFTAELQARYGTGECIAVLPLVYFAAPGASPEVPELAVLLAQEIAQILGSHLAPSEVPAIGPARLVDGYLPHREVRADGARFETFESLADARHLGAHLGVDGLVFGTLRRVASQGASVPNTFAIELSALDTRGARPSFAHGIELTAAELGAPLLELERSSRWVATREPEWTRRTNRASDLESALACLAQRWSQRAPARSSPGERWVMLPVEDPDPTASLELLDSAARVAAALDARAGREEQVDTEAALERFEARRAELWAGPRIAVLEHASERVAQALRGAAAPVNLLPARAVERTSTGVWPSELGLHGARRRAQLLPAAGTDGYPYVLALRIEPWNGEQLLELSTHRTADGSRSSVTWVVLTADHVEQLCRSTD
jgi:hypothetical protein